MTQELRRLAEAATQGEWHWDCDEVKGDPFGRVRYQVITSGKTITKIYYSSYEGGPTNAKDDAAYIAAANPAAILALLDRLEKAEKDVWRLREKCDHSMSEVNRLAVKCSNLHEALKESREALQFANDTPNGPICDTIWMMHRPEMLFDFMDAAMEASK